MQWYVWPTRYHYPNPSLNIVSSPGPFVQLKKEVWRMMGVESVTTKPIVLKMDNDVMEIFEKAGLVAFFCKFVGLNESISIQVVDTWDNGWALRVLFK